MAAVAQSKLPPRNAFPFFDDRWKMEQLWKVSPVTRVCQTKDERHTSQKSPVLGLPLGVRPRFRSDFDFYFFFYISRAVPSFTGFLFFQLLFNPTTHVAVVVVVVGVVVGVFRHHAHEQHLNALFF